MNIIFGKLGHETNTFSVERGDFKRWSQTGWYTGEDVITVHREKLIIHLV